MEYMYIPIIILLIFYIVGEITEVKDLRIGSILMLFIISSFLIFINSVLEEIQTKERVEPKVIIKTEEIDGIKISDTTYVYKF